MLSLTSPRHTSTLRIALKNPVSWEQPLASWTAIGEAKLGPFASCGEYGRRKGDELRQFPQVLGSGSQ